jgi:hypothetical protein
VESAGIMAGAGRAGGNRGEKQRLFGRGWGLDSAADKHSEVRSEQEEGSAGDGWGSDNIRPTLPCSKR